MTDIEAKLEHLKSCLGEKKLKQIGLIPCSTCRDIMVNALNLELPPDLENKPFLTPEEVSRINESILHPELHTMQNTPVNDDDSFSSTDMDEPSDTLLTNDSDTISSFSDMDELAQEHITDTLNNAPNPSSDLSIENSSSNSDFEISPQLVASLNTTPTQTEQELVTKLLAILSHSHHSTHSNLDIGYIYSMPSIQLPHSLACSECGRLYAITHPDTKLIPLPVYLSDTEYEMIKGIYVDILL